MIANSYDYYYLEINGFEDDNENDEDYIKDMMADDINELLTQY